MLNKGVNTMLTLSSRANHHSPETYRALQAAEGYVFLRLHREALKELDAIEQADQEDSDVMIARIRILLHLGRFSAAARLSARGESLYSQEDEFTVQRAFALHQLDKGDEAARVIQSAPEWLRRTGILHYNFGCYQARWGNLQTARQFVKAAIQLNAAIELSMKKDPDLAGLWN
jgi:tetratricopeptide (TPR) repeat protein